MARSGTVIDRDLGWKHIRAQIAILAKKPQAVIGVRGAQADEKKKEDDGSTANISLAEVATIHEYGAPAAGIPERSYIRSTVDENIVSYRRTIESLKDQLFNPKNPLTVRRALLILGEKVKADIRSKIRAGLSPAWAESTREGRISRAGGAIVAETPLIDTGQLIGGITNDAEFPDGSKV